MLVLTFLNLPCDNKDHIKLINTSKVVSVIVLSLPKFKKSHVIGSELNPDFDDCIFLVFSNDHALAVKSSGFIGTRLKRNLKF